MKRLLIVLVTKDHPAYLRQFFKYQDKQLPEGVEGLVVISNKDKESKEIVLKEQRKKWKVFEEDSEKSLDSKIIDHLDENQYMFTWVIGDGLIITPSILEDKILPVLTDSCLLYHLTDKTSFDTRRYYSKNNFSLVEPTQDPLKYFSNFFWTSTFLGSLIINHSLIEEVKRSKCCKKNIGTGFALITGVLDALTQFKQPTIETRLLSYYLPNPQKGESIWLKDGRVFEIWASNLSSALNQLPNFYLSKIDVVLSRVCINNNIFSFRGLVELRARGVLNETNLKKYGNGLKKVTNVNRSIILALCYCPVFFTKMLVWPLKVRKFLKRKIYARIFN